jgi:type II secretory ATPase GspE/PulE/Tfp pilus assembly ATPase PilB-like protein
MPRSLPPRPSIVFLQKEAKDLLKKHRASDASCCPTLRYHFRFSKADDDQILKSKFSLQEAQHALALDYGFKGWKELKSEVEKTSGSLPLVPDAPSLLGELIHKAIADNASDIHIEPMTEETKVRYRVDGILHELRTLSRESGQALVSEVANASMLDSDHMDRAQDGRMLINVDGRKIDIRVNATPVIHGSVVVLRLLDREPIDFSLASVAMEPEQLKRYKRQIARPNGVILFAGPTGCGKTTTLYATLSDLNTEQRKIITAEDPVEFAIDGIDQIPIRPDAGLGFEQAIRSALRQDPDVIMVGEVRNLGVANLLVQASMTGHLVFSTLHSNDCPGTLTRLVNMGLEPYLVTDAVTCVVSQRLVRKICESCKTEFRLQDGEFASLHLSDEDRSRPIFRGAGCKECKQSGYKGRTAVYSILEMTPEIARQVHKKDEEAIRSAARANGWTTLKEAATRKMLKGITTAEQVLSVF